MIKLMTIVSLLASLSAIGQVVLDNTTVETQKGENPAALITLKGEGGSMMFEYMKLANEKNPEYIIKDDTKFKSTENGLVCDQGIGQCTISFNSQGCLSELRSFTTGNSAKNDMTLASSVFRGSAYVALNLFDNAAKFMYNYMLDVFTKGATDCQVREGGGLGADSSLSVPGKGLKCNKDGNTYECIIRFDEKGLIYSR